MVFRQHWVRASCLAANTAAGRRVRAQRQTQEELRMEAKPSRADDALRHSSLGASTPV